MADDPLQPDEHRPGDSENTESPIDASPALPGAMGDEAESQPVPVTLARQPAALTSRTTVAPAVERRIGTPSLRPSQGRRRIIVPVALFLLTCLSTFWAGSHTRILMGTDGSFIVFGEWAEGLVYMGCVMSILFAHEMGHFLQAVRYGVPASLPYFLPMPIIPTGTMGAVIGMRGFNADRKELFDIGITGPWAGLIVALPMACWGIYVAGHGPAGEAGLHFGDPFVFKWLMHVLRPDVPAGNELFMNPYLMAGWFGMLITGLNMLPISQLDGGHVSYALLGRRAHWLARGLVLAAIGFVVFGGHEARAWTLMLVLVLLIGADHPPTADDRATLGPVRRTLGWLSLAIPLFCLTPYPIYDVPSGSAPPAPRQALPEPELIVESIAPPEGGYFVAVAASCRPRLPAEVCEDFVSR